MNEIFDFIKNPEIISKILAIFWVSVVSGIFYFINSYVFKVIISKFPKSLRKPIKIARSVIKVVIIIFTIIAILDKLGFDIGGLVASFGVTGFIVTFAMKDLLTSAASGGMVIIFRPFKVGDIIRVSTIEGEVRKIDWQYTAISKDGKDYYIPNNKVSSEAIIIRNSES